MSNSIAKKINSKSLKNFPLSSVLLFLYFSFNRRRCNPASNAKKPVTKDDIRENIINYCDEGGGENDMMTFDMKTLKIPMSTQLPELVQHKATSSECSEGILTAFVTNFASFSNISFNYKKQDQT